jgi:hypothetical protein
MVGDEVHAVRFFRSLEILVAKIVFILSRIRLKIGERGSIIADHFRILYPVFSMCNVHHDTARKHTIRIPRLR